MHVFLLIISVLVHSQWTWSSNDYTDIVHPQGLLNAVFFYNGKNWCLWGGQEHKNVKFNQLQRKVVDIGNGGLTVAYEHTEHGSKNHSGRIKQCVTQYKDPNAGARCYVTILDQYLLKVPKNANEQGGGLFEALRPKDPAARCFPFSQWEGIS